MFGCLSCALFFLEPALIIGDNIDFIVILSLSVWVIYTLDHIADGFKETGNSGILRYDFNYKYRVILLVLCLIFSTLIVFLIYKNKAALFVQNGLWLVFVLPLYFFLKLKGFFTPIFKMIVISIVVATVVVLLYNSSNLFTDMLSMEWIIMVLLALLNQLVLEYYECHEGKNITESSSDLFYLSMAKSVFIWMVVFLVISTIQNIHAWPFTASIFLTALFLRLIIAFPTKFQKERAYRYWADFSFILMWPLLKVFLLLICRKW